MATFYFGLKVNALERQRYRFSWEDITKGSRILAEKCITRFHADAVLTFSGAGSIIANLALLDAKQLLPLFTVIEIEKPESAVTEIHGYFLVETTKWLLFVPEAVRALADKRLAVLHDCCVSGDGLMLIKKALVKTGFPAQNVRTGVLVCSQTAIETNKSPDVYAFCVEHATFHFPWGEKK